MALNIDLNLLPPEEDMVIENEEINHTPSSQGLPAIQARHESQDGDDDVMIISPRTFAQATEGSSRRERPRLPEVIYDTSPPLPQYFNPGPSVEQAPANSLGEETPEKENSETHDQQLTCPICISDFTEATVTKCGHIFCKECIRSAIRIQKKCPTCRRKLIQRDTFRIYISN